MLGGKFIMSPSFGVCGLGSNMCVSYHDPLCYNHLSQKRYGHFTVVKTEPMAKISANGAKFFKAKRVRRAPISGLSLEPFPATRHVA